MDSKILVVDFDGTLTLSNDWPFITDFDMEMVEAFIAAGKAGHILILNTCRVEECLQDAIDSLCLLGLKFDSVNDNYMWDE